MNKKQLSICIITKNDEKYLTDCLKEIKNYADEIIIADIGSTDNTVYVAENADVNVYKPEWKNDFSEVKNFCMEKAEGKWVLFLHANEIISGEHLGQLMLLLNNPNAEGYLLYINYNSNEYSISSPVQSLRLLRNREEYRYHYKSFEMIPNEVLSNIKNCGIQIVKRDSELSWEIKLRVRLLEDEIAENSKDSYLQYMYGIKLLNHQKFEESIMNFKKSIDKINYGYFYTPHLFKCLCWSLLYLKQYSDALMFLNDGIDNFPFYTDLFVLRGELYRQQRQYDKAIQDFKTCLKIREQPNNMVPAPEIDIPVILETFGDMHEEIFNFKQALSSYQQAYDFINTDYEYLYKICELSKKVGISEAVENIFDTSIEQENSEQLLMLINVLFNQREYKKVLSYTEKFENVFGKADEIESIKLSCRMMLREISEDSFNINKRSSFYSQSLMGRIEYYWINNKWMKAKLLIDELEKREDIGQPVIDVYYLINRIFTKEEVYYRKLEEQEYEIAINLYENLLWLGQEEKAKKILPLLLIGQEENFVRLAEPWAEQNNFEIIQIIFKNIFDEEKQIEFKNKIIGNLLSKGYIQTAEALVMLGHTEINEELKCVLISASYLQKLENWICKFQNPVLFVNRNIIMTNNIFDKPIKSLTNFYFSLNLQENAGENISEDIRTERTNAEMHKEIGDYFEKNQKSNEAFSSYLRVLQWDPNNTYAQEKIWISYNENPNRFTDLINERAWNLEGEYFIDKKDFINFINGLIYFKNKKIDEARTYFCKIKESKINRTMLQAYIIGSLWLDEKEPEAEVLIKKNARTINFFILLFGICKDYTICRLMEYQEKYPYSELIYEERERIYSRNIFC